MNTLQILLFMLHSKKNIDFILDIIIKTLNLELIITKEGFIITDNLIQTNYEK